MRKIVLFGAGKIGRSFIGQLFSLAGYEVVFVDLNRLMIEELNRKKAYEVVIKSNAPDEIMVIRNVRGLMISEVEAVATELADCDIVGISVGQAGLQGILPILAKGLLRRREKMGNIPLDIIIAENMRNAEVFIKKTLITLLGSKYPIDDLVGLVETSIGKMVPIISAEEQEKDILRVFAEPYNTLILDKKAFKNPIPEVEGLSPKENIKAWVDRKSYIHNFGHVAAVYSGYQANPSKKYLYDVLANKDVKSFTREAMLQSAQVLIKKYPEEFTYTDLCYHIDDLLLRFENRALGDTVYRVGCDLKRKLHRNDRILSPAMDGIRFQCPIGLILLTFFYGLGFRATNDLGMSFPGDVDFFSQLSHKGLSKILQEICGLDDSKDFMIISQIRNYYHHTIEVDISW